MQLRQRIVQSCALLFTCLGLVVISSHNREAIAQDLEQPPDQLPTQPSQGGDELALSDTFAFAINAEVEVESVETLDPSNFNDLLLTAYQSQAVWANDPLWVGLQFLQFLSLPMTGANQQVSVFIPGEWEPGMEFDYARVVIEDKGWLDDAVAGERYVLWIVLGNEGEFRIQRALRANICRRPDQEFYSAQACP